MKVDLFTTQMFSEELKDNFELPANPYHPNEKVKPIAEKVFEKYIRSLGVFYWSDFRLDRRSKIFDFTKEYVKGEQIRCYRCSFYLDERTLKIKDWPNPSRNSFSKRAWHKWNVVGDFEYVVFDDIAVRTTAFRFKEDLEKNISRITGSTFSPKKNEGNYQKVLDPNPRGLR